MAKVVEEMVVVRFSRLIRDSEVESVVDNNLIAEIEGALAKVAPEGVLVEVITEKD